MFVHESAVRRRRPLGEWRAVLPNPSRKALEAIVRSAAVLAYITPSTAAIAAGIPVREARVYLEFLADQQLVSEPLRNDRQNGRAVYFDRKGIETALERLRTALTSTNQQGAAA